jgi:hypothetical protein
VVFGLVYWFYFHEYAIGKLQPQKYAEAQAAAEAERSIVTDESLEALAADESAIAAGQEIFMAQCFACQPWTPILGETGVNQVVAYILTIQNTEIPGKAPEGDLWEPGGTVADDAGSPEDADSGP